MLNGLNIWIVNHYAIAPGMGGGSRHYDLAKHLVKQGANITIFASGVGHQNGVNVFDKRKGNRLDENYDGVKYVWLRTQPYERNDWRRVKNMLDFTWRCYLAAKRMDEKPDLIIGSLMHPLAAWIASCIASYYRVPFYFEERDLWPQTLIDFGKMSAKHPIVKVLFLLEASLYRKAKRIIVLFDKAVDYVNDKSGKGSSTLVLPNGVDLERFESPFADLPAALHEWIQARKDHFIAVYTGSHGISDGLDSLVDAAKLLSENDRIHFLFVGNGPEKEALMKRAQDENITNIYFHQPIVKEQIPALLNQCHVGLIALRDASIYKWGMSFNKLYDYMASSLPTLLLGKLSDSPIESERIGYVVHTPEQLRDVIVQLSESKEEREFIGRRARHYVELRHNWSVLSRELGGAIATDTQSSYVISDELIVDADTSKIRKKGLDV